MFEIALPVTTKTELITKIIDDLDDEGFVLSKSDVQAVFQSLEEVAKAELNNAQRVKIGNLVILEPKLVKAKPKREVRNPATGEMIQKDKEPASTKVAAKALKAAKDAAPTVQRVKKQLAK